MFSSKDDTVHTINPTARKTAPESPKEAGTVETGLYSIATRAGRQMRDFLHNANEEMVHTKDRVAAQIRNKPMQTALIALTTGLVLGLLLRSRR